MNDVDDELLVRAMRLIGDAVVIAGADGTILFWNGGATRLFGWSAEEVEGRPLDLIIPERFRERHWEGWRSAMAAGAVSAEGRLLEVPALHKNGRIISIAFTVALVEDGPGGRPAIVAVLRDDTERRAERRMLTTRIQELEAADARAV